MDIKNRLYRKPDVYNLIAYKDGRVVGVLTWREITVSEAHLLNLQVNENYRRQGIATALIDAWRALGHRWHSVTSFSEDATHLWDAYKAAHDDVTTDPRPTHGLFAHHNDSTNRL